MRNESVRSITDFNNPGYMVEEETTRSRDDNPNPVRFITILMIRRVDKESTFEVRGGGGRV